jgi:hypothetical protein
VQLTVQTVGDGHGAADIADRRWDLEQVQASITKLAELAQRAVVQVAPHEAKVEFGVAIKAEAGKLTGLLVSGGAEANFKITLTWRQSDTTQETSPAGTLR